jgi:hypothetical protein
MAETPPLSVDDAKRLIKDAKEQNDASSQIMESLETVFGPRGPLSTGDPLVATDNQENKDLYAATLRLNLLVEDKSTRLLRGVTPALEGTKFPAGIMMAQCTGGGTFLTRDAGGTPVFEKVNDSGSGKSEVVTLKVGTLEPSYQVIDAGANGVCFDLVSNAAKQAKPKLPQR